ncbi:YdeI/OmpD-associated family protein [Treponema sp.]
MPSYVKERIESAGLMRAYQERPYYQRNDYVGWILQAKREPTKEKRIAQMLEELASGDRYMNSEYTVKR